MDVCSRSVLSVSEDISSFRELSVDSLKSPRIVVVESSADDIGKCLTEHLSVHGDQEFVSGSVTPSAGLVDAKRDIDPNPHQGNTSEKCLSKSATFPSSATPSTATSLGGKSSDEASDITSGISEQNDDTESVTSSYPRSISLPTPRKLVSALKGSREKQGIPPMKLTVKWAPDVYDPVPTAVSHVVTNNKPQRHNRKNSKNKQKVGGKNSRGSKSKDKDKKQGRKHGGSSSRGFKIMDYDEKVAEFDEQPQPCVMDFNVGNTDQYCGSSFLKKSVASLHFSVAEAT